MSYLALARKWRPRTFSQLLGQEHINKPLINALNQQRLHHAYLFTGTRGVGKTSVARILAKSLNCELGISPTPCLTCDACVAIEQGRFIDLIEIDGASKTRVEDTRDLLDNVQYAPTSGRFKIYLIDEVHMLSQHSFNALLKTLEEPPLHVKFILATTDPQKLPVTVLSRCLQFHLNHLPAELIKSHLHHILEEEHLAHEDEALTILSHAAQGSMRDALSLLDQAITGCTDQLLASDVKIILGYTLHDYALQILFALAQQNAPLLLSLSQKILTEGGHFHYVLDEMLQYFHDLCVYQSLGGINPLINPSSEVISLASLFSAEDLQLFYQIGIKGREEISLAPTLTVGFNMTILRMLTFRPTPKAPVPTLAYDYQAPNPIEMPKQPESASITVTTVDPAKEHRIVEEPVINAPSTSAARSTLISSHPTTNNPNNLSWPDVVSKLKLTGIALNALDNAELVSIDGKMITIKVAKGHQSLFTPTVMNRIEAALSDYYEHTIKITLLTETQVQASPAQQKEKIVQEKHLNATSALEVDDVFQQIKKEFSAELVKNSIVPLKDGL
jgi:DNA polymerase-3 subunit gamma/tau